MTSSPGNSSFSSQGVQRPGAGIPARERREYLAKFEHQLLELVELRVLHGARLSMADSN